jgi:hypothetical protein
LGAIWISRRRPDAATETAATVIERQGFRHGERLQTPTHEVLVYPRQQSEEPAMVHRRPNGGWIAAAGSPLRGKLRDTDPLADLFDEFDGTTQGLEVAGTFALVVYKAGRLHITTDRLSAFPVFRGDSGAVSTSWLALAMTEPRISFRRLRRLRVRPHWMPYRRRHAGARDPPTSVVLDPDAQRRRRGAGRADPGAARPGHAAPERAARGDRAAAVPVSRRGLGGHGWARRRRAVGRAGFASARGVRAPARGHPTSARLRRRQPQRRGRPGAGGRDRRAADR